MRKFCKLCILGIKKPPLPFGGRGLAVISILLDYL